MRLVRHALLTALIALGSCAPVWAAKPEWDQVANIKEAAERLAKLHRSEGSQGVLKFLEACYKTHTLASKFSRGLEGCLAQDYMHSQVLAVVYAKLPEDARAKTGAPTPEAIGKSMGHRFASIFAQYNITAAQSQSLKDAVDKHGFPIFLKAVFPNAGTAGAPHADNGGEK